MSFVVLTWCIPPCSEAWPCPRKERPLASTHQDVLSELHCTDLKHHQLSLLFYIENRYYVLLSHLVFLKSMALFSIHFSDLLFEPPSESVFTRNAFDFVSTKKLLDSHSSRLQQNITAHRRNLWFYISNTYDMNIHLHIMGLKLSIPQKPCKNTAFSSPFMFFIIHLLINILVYDR